MSHHPFHIVDLSPWPLTSSLSIFLTFLSVTYLIQYKHLMPLTITMMILTISAIQWWRDIIRESTFQGNHSMKVITGLKMGMLLFIVSEIMFFLSFFWAFFHSSLSPSIQIHSLWPPTSIIAFNPLSIPLLNTTILISSGISITWAHHSMLNFNYKEATNALLITILLGLYFSMLQAWEYYEAPFSVADSIFGATFFVSTGFHGLHVIIGTTFLMISYIRMTNLQFSSFHHFGFEAAAWYWHFVDIVWLFLYSMIYWWGN